MRSPPLLLFCSVILLSTAFGEVEYEDYLDVIGSAGTMTGANYSEYGSAFEEFVASGPCTRNLSSYPGSLVDFLEGVPDPTETNCSLYSPAFEDFMNWSGENLSGRG